MVILPNLNIKRKLYPLFSILLYTTLCYKSILGSIFNYNIVEVIIMRPLKEKISITIDSDLLEKLREKADEDDRSLSQYINLILKSYIHAIER